MMVTPLIITPEARPIATSIVETALFPRASFCDCQGALLNLLAVKGRNRCLSFLVGGHLDKSEPFGALRDPVANDAN
jgi:hypothetical protein